MSVMREALMRNPEEQLLARCRTGDMDAFAHIYARYEQRVFRYAYHLLGHREDADDVKQETFIKAYQSIGAFRGEASLQTWLLTICGNLCRDRIKSWERRKVQYHAEISDDLMTSAESADPLRIVERTDMLDTILCALQHLPTAQREILILHEVEELDYREISRVLGCTPISAKLRLFRARRALQERVKGLLE